MLNKSFLVLSLLACLAFRVNAEQAVTPPGLEYCTVCHGSQLKGNSNIGAPRLSGLSTWYLSRQLRNFKQGVRGAHPEDVTGKEMMSMVTHLSDQQLTEIVEWITTTESELPRPSISGDIQSGKALYKSCAVCHGEGAQGNEQLGAPKLRGLNDWYILTQLNHFRQGLRGIETRDAFGQQMQAASQILTTEQEATDIASYIQQLSITKSKS